VAYGYVLVVKRTRDDVFTYEAWGPREAIDDRRGAILTSAVAADVTRADREVGVVAATFEIVGPSLSRSADCEPILRALPDWFGIESAVARYVAEIDGLATWVAAEGPGRAIGFLTLKRHNPYSAELYALGVRPDRHRLGVGRSLVAAAEAWAAADGVEYLHVKTLGPSRPDPGYDATRAFYAAVGFRPLEESTVPWGPANPCLVMVKRIGPA